MVETHQGVLFVNPGSPSLVKQHPRLGTVGILEITPETRAARIIDLAALDG
jgi:predicted phosphodiesterase